MLFSLGFPADAIAVFIHWRVAASRRRRRFHFLVCRGQRWPSSGVGFAATGLRRAGEGSASCFLSDFRLTRSRSLSIGGWQPSRRRRRFHFLVCRGQRWPSSGVGFAATGLRRAGEGSASCFLSRISG